MWEIADDASGPRGPVDEWWTAGGGAGAALVLPDGCVDVIAEAGRLRVVGPMTRARWVRVGPAVEGIRFRPGAVARWLGHRLPELGDRVAPAAAFSSLKGVVSLSQVLELAAAARPCPEAVYAAQRLRDEPGQRVANLARALSTSERQLHRLFLAELGVPPKVFARLQRLQYLAARLAAEPEAPLVDLSLASGYVDQPHMNRDVAALCGMTPVQLRRALVSDSSKTGPDGQ